jgi:hypothetical protein
VRSDGSVAILTIDKTEDMLCVHTLSTTGTVEDVVVLPDTREDRVYYVVRRVVGGIYYRFLEKLSTEADCQGGDVNRQLDAYVADDSSSGATISGLDHLEGEEIVVWADGVHQGTFTVSSGAVSCTHSRGYVAGLTYQATYKSTKLVTQKDGGLSFPDRKRMCRLSIIARNIHPLALEFGANFDDMDRLPTTEDYEDVDQDTVMASYHQESFEVPGEWTSDARLCIRATSPYPVTLLVAQAEF